MCGIAGFLDLRGRPAEAGLLKPMADAIAHRGPDGEGYFAQGPCGLAHRRLAIIDRGPAGRQPMSGASGRFTLSYNGEVYNFRELRSELEGLGRRFVSRSDTEVVLQAWEEWGPACVPRFNGMFAFALWDDREQALFLVRDRYGIKPLYWTVWDNVLVFGSEQKALLAHPHARREVDREALLEYFTFQNLFTDRTLLRGVRMLPAATIARVGRGDGTPVLERYWDWCFREPEVAVEPREAVEELRRLMAQAVSRQMVSDVEVGAYLSGGIDSGAITAFAAGMSPYLKSFTCGFDLSSASGIELGFDERVRAEAMSALFRTEHYEMVLKAGDMERILPAVVRAIEEPRVGQSYPNYYAARLASRFVKVVLSGAGGDELFGGYPWRYYRAAVCTGFEDYIDQYYLFWQRLIPNRSIQKVFAPIWGDVKHVWTRDIFRDVFLSRDISLRRPVDYINHSMYFEAKTFLHGLLVVEDKLSMANSLETRVPFLDNDLVDFAQQVPVGLKLSNLDQVVRLNENEPGPKTSVYFQKAKDGKRLLRDAMRSVIPDHVVDAEKQGFSAPDASWFKGQSIDFVRRRLLQGSPRIYEFMDREAVRSLVEEHLQGTCNRRLLIWSLLSVEEWLGGMDA